MHIHLCRDSHKATNLALDDDLIEEARQLGGLRTKKDVVTQALVEYVQRRKQVKLLDLFGTIDLNEGFDPKTQRRVRRTPSLQCGEQTSGHVGSTST